MNSRSLLRPLLLASIVLPALVPAAVHAESITSFDVSASLSKNREVSFIETIGYDFGDLDKHGIYRDIPISYSRNGGNYELRLNVQGVTRDGDAEDFSQSTQDGTLELKIGNADQTITGTHQYVLNYNTDRAINFFPDHDELYWNVTGNGWEVPIEKTSFSLSLPPGVDLASVSSTCFTGEFGSTEHACAISQQPNGQITVTATRVLEAGEGLTVVVGVPKGVIAAPTLSDMVWQVLSDNGVLFFPLVAFIVMFLLWWKFGRDPKLGTVIPEYEAPQKLSPALCGALMTNGDVPSRTITATIIDLARRGYLKIRFEEQKTMLGLGNKQTYTFVRLKDPDSHLAAYETTLFNGLFKYGIETKISELQTNKFYLEVAAYKKQVQAIIDGMGVFAKNPAAVRAGFIVVGVLCTWGMFFIFGSTGIGVVSAVLTAAVIIGFGMVMPRRTDAGVRLFADLKGFKWFLSVTEKDRLDFHDAPERTPEQFMDLLPYAIVFEVEKKWAEQFASMDIPPPSWAEGAGTGRLNTLIFISNLESMHTAATSSGYAAPSSAGGGGSGFSGGGSGGGFGGGGGGSW